MTLDSSYWVSKTLLLLTADDQAQAGPFRREILVRDLTQTQLLYPMLR